MEEDEGAIEYPQQYQVQQAQAPEASEASGNAAGAIAGGVAAGVGVAAVAVAAYAYGNESDSEDGGRDLVEEKSSDGDDELFGVEGDEGIEWTAEGVWNPYDGYTKQAPEADKSRGSVSSISESRATDSLATGSRSGPRAWMKSWSSIDSRRDQSRRAPPDANAYMKSWSSIDSARQRSAPDSLLGSMENDTSSEVEEFIVVSERNTVEVDTLDSTKASSTTSNAVRMSPTIEATEVVAVKRSAVEESKDEDDADSVLTEDIVKEVSRLARFVKKYDKKRERKMMKELEREEKAKLAIKDSQGSQSIPSESVGYDAMSDSISALRKGKVETSPRRERTALANPVEETDESDESERSWSTTSNANRAFDDEESSPVVDDSEIADDSSDDESISVSVTDSDISRLGITPISVQKVQMSRSANPARRSRRDDSSVPETSRPPVSKQSRQKGLPPLPGTPGSPDEDDSPEKMHTPVQTIRKAMKRVSSARQQKFSPKNKQEQSPPTRQSRGVDLTEEALLGLSEGDGPAGVISPQYQQQKVALSNLRKNEAILDTASSHFTGGVTSSEYEEAFKAGVIAQQKQRKVFLERKSFEQMRNRVPQDPPASTAESASLHATDEKRSPPGWEAGSAEYLVAEEKRVPPAQASPRGRQRSMSGSQNSFDAAPPPQASREIDSTSRHMTEEKAKPFKAPSFKPGVQPANSPLRRNKAATTEPQSGSKRAAPEAAPQGQEVAPVAQISPAARSPRRKKRGSAFDNVINMFEQKPHNAIYPAGANWQFNGATR